MTKYCAICGFNTRDGIFPAPTNYPDKFVHIACLQDKREYLNLSSKR